MQNNSITNNIVYSGSAYPEITRQPNRSGALRISMEGVKSFLIENNYMEASEAGRKDTPKEAIVQGVFRAFREGKLSLNATPQKGVSNLTPVRLSTGLKGKLDDVPAISTISLANDFCLARMKNPDFVCSECYVPASLRIDGILQYTQNLFVLTMAELPEAWIPVISLDPAVFPIIRLESFGDLASTIQAKNYLTIAKKNFAFSFGLWTKNPAVFASAVDLLGKPENLSAVWSASRINVMDPAAYIEKYSRYFDHFFIVAENREIADSLLSEAGYTSIPCKCGFHSCYDCQVCYHVTDIMTRLIELLRKQLKKGKRKARK